MHKHVPMAAWVIYHRLRGALCVIWLLYYLSISIETVQRILTQYIYTAEYIDLSQLLCMRPSTSARIIPPCTVSGSSQAVEINCVLLV